jgi:hypothetical protein
MGQPHPVYDLPVGWSPRHSYVIDVIVTSGWVIDELGDIDASAGVCSNPSHDGVELVPAELDGGRS